jgi:hypothetical protein
MKYIRPLVELIHYKHLENMLMNISLIIAVYKNIDFLDLVLRSVARQSMTDFEVIIAEDNDAPK